jgi:hypothetical protein
MRLTRPATSRRFALPGRSRQHPEQDEPDQADDEGRNQRLGGGRDGGQRQYDQQQDGGEGDESIHATNAITCRKQEDINPPELGTTETIWEWRGDELSGSGLRSSPTPNA